MSLFVIPRNGIGNRLRAIAASSFLARKLGRKLSVVWEEEELLPGGWEKIFAPNSTIEFSSWDPNEKSRFFENGEVPLYLQELRDVVSLRGHDKGEQRFAHSFYRKLRQSPEKLAVVMAGDFFLASAKSVAKAGKRLARERRQIAARLRFQPEILERVKRHAPREQYVSLHLRGTDRRHDAAAPNELFERVEVVSQRLGITSVFAASEDPNLLIMASRQLASKGIQVFTSSSTGIRGSVDGTLDSFRDYVLLRRGEAFVGSKLSTFSTEIGVTFGRKCYLF